MDQDPPPANNEMLAELNFLRSVRGYLGRRKLRFAIIGFAGSGKTAFLMNAEAVLQGTLTFVPPHLGMAGRHGTRWLCQRSFTTNVIGPGEELTFVSLDMKGFALDGAEGWRRDLIAFEAQIIACGIFPLRLLNLPDEARMTQEPIQQHAQDAMLLVFGANMIGVTTAEACLAAIADRLADTQLPVFIVLTKIDLLPATMAVDDAIDHLVHLTGMNRAFIFPLANALENRQLPSPATTLQILRLFSQVVRHSQDIRPYVPSLRRRASARVTEMRYIIRQRREEFVERVLHLNKILLIVVLLLGLVVAYLAGSRRS